MVTTHQRFKTEVYNIKEEGPEGEKKTHSQKVQKIDTQGQGSNGNSELPESKR